MSNTPATAPNKDHPKDEKSKDVHPAPANAPAADKPAEKVVAAK